MNKQRIWNRNFTSIWISTCLFFTVFFSLMSTMPLFVTNSLNSGSKESGIVVTIFIIASLLFRFFSGKLIDRFGKKKILFLSAILFLVCSSFYLIVESLTQLLLLRFIHGMSFGIASTATGSIAADIVPSERKGEGIGYYSLSYTMAMFLGPYFGLMIINQFDYLIYFVFLTLLSFMAFMLLTNIKFRSLHLESKSDVQKGSFWNDMIEVKAVPIGVTSIFIAIAYSGFLTFIPMYALKLGLGSIAGYFYVIYAITIVLLRPITGKVFDRYNEHFVMYPAILVSAIGFICLSLAHSGFLFLLSAAIIGAGIGSLSPSLQTIAVKSTSNERSGIATATFLNAFDIGVGLGSFVIGILVSSTSFSFVYFVSALGVLFSAFIYYFLYHRNKNMNTVKIIDIQS